MMQNKAIRILTLTSKKNLKINFFPPASNWFPARKLPLCSVTPAAATLQSHFEFTPKSSNAAVWPLARFHFLFFPPQNATQWVSGTQLHRQFTATHNNQEINVKLKSKLLIKSKMSTQPIKYVEFEQTTQAQKRGDGGDPCQNQGFTWFRKWLLLLLGSYIIDRKLLPGDC